MMVGGGEKERNKKMMGQMCGHVTYRTDHDESSVGVLYFSGLKGHVI